MIREKLLNLLLEYATSIGLDCSIRDSSNPYGLFLNKKEWYIVIMNPASQSNVYWIALSNHNSMCRFNLNDPDCISMLKSVIDGYKKYV